MNEVNIIIGDIKLTYNDYNLNVFQCKKLFYSIIARWLENNLNVRWAQVLHTEI